MQPQLGEFQTVYLVFYLPISYYYWLKSKACLPQSGAFLSLLWRHPTSHKCLLFSITEPVCYLHLSYSSLRPQHAPRFSLPILFFLCLLKCSSSFLDYLKIPSSRRLKICKREPGQCWLPNTACTHASEITVNKKLGTDKGVHTCKSSMET